MEALDRESFEFRADFFGRTIEQELVGCLDGPRGAEARAQLAVLAERRRVRVEDIVAREERQRPSLLPWWWRARVACDRACVAVPTESEAEPRVVYRVDECPVCTGDAHMGALACGHMVCRDCFDHMRERPQLCVGTAVRCPQCRVPSQRHWYR